MGILNLRRHITPSIQDEYPIYVGFCDNR